MIRLIITADDFGYSKHFNRMILELIAENAVTSTSVMVNEIDTGQKGQVERLVMLARKGLVSVGLHIHFQNARFEDEIEQQFARFIEIFGFNPSHLDIHKTDFLEDGYPAIQEFCKQRRIPCKNLSLFGDKIMTVNGVITTRDPIFDGTGKSFSEIVEWVNSLKTGFHVLNFHPGYYDPDSRSSLNKEREVDAENIRKVIDSLDMPSIELANFTDLANAHK